MSQPQRSNKPTPMWVSTPGGCPIAGPFDLWRKSYFLDHGTVPADTMKMYPSLSATVVNDIAHLAYSGELTPEEIVARFTSAEADDEIQMAYTYLSQWHEAAPFLPDNMQHLPQLPNLQPPAWAEQSPDETELT